MTLPPIRLFLVRHGQSEANLDNTVYQHKPDFAVALSPAGHQQAAAAGAALAAYLTRDAPGPSRRLRLLVSPYVRTRQTADGIAAALTAADRVFDRREVSELRELSFGIFDGLSDEQIRAEYPREHAHYEKHKRVAGEMFAPMPLGESRIQVGDRVRQMFGTILRDASDTEGRTPVLDFVIVAHGVTIRQFRQRWLHHPWEWAEALPNPANCSIGLIEGRAGQTLDPQGASYRESDVFAGFPTTHASTQDRREAGHVD